MDELMTDWLTDSLTDRLVDWLTDWLADWLANLMTDDFACKKITDLLILILLVQLYLKLADGMTD